MEVNYLSNIFQSMFFQIIIYRIRKFAGDTESLIRCDIEYTTGANDKIWVKPPI